MSYCSPTSGRSGSELSVNDVPQFAVHQGKVCLHPLEAGVLVIQLPHAQLMRDRHDRILVLQLLVGWLAHAVLATSLTAPGAQFYLFKDRSDQAFTESGSLR